MKIKLKISKKQVLHLALFLGIIAAANALDIYFDKNPVDIKTAENESGETAEKPGKVYLFSQANTTAAKTSVQKNPVRRFFEQHDKFLQRYHETASFRDLKIDEKHPKTHLFLTFHHFLFRNYYFSVPDDDPHLA